MAKKNPLRQRRNGFYFGAASKPRKTAPLKRSAPLQILHLNALF
jgi:hypothetical protein